MGLFEQLPYTNFSNINLTEIIRAIKQLEKEMHDFTIVNKIEYMGAWDITTQYPSWSVVVVGGTTGYISIQPVPVGINYTNTDYWRLIADFSIELANLGNRVATLENEVDELTDNISKTSWLDNKNVVWYGDSWGTTAGNVITHFTENFPNVNVTNRCIGGTALSRMTITGYETLSGYQRITTDDLSGFDYIFIMYGVNDWQLSKKMKTKTPDEYEYLYCVEHVIEYLKNNYPTLKPVFILQSYCYSSTAFSSNGLDGVNYSGCTQQAYINNCIEVCERFNIPYINLYELVGVNRYNYTHFMRNDNGAYVHPHSFLFDLMSLLIYRGVFNTGKVYGNNFGCNIMPSVVPEVVPTLSTYQTLISGVDMYPMRVVTSNDVHSLVYMNNKNAVIIAHITGYKNSANLLGVSYDSHNIGESNVRTFLGNVSGENYIDMYIEVPRKDMFAPAFKTDSTEYLMYGVSCSIFGGGDVAETEYQEPTSDNENVVITNSFKPTIVNGEVKNEHIRFQANSNINAYSILIKGLPKIYTSQAMYLMGIDQTTGTSTMFYLYDGKIRNSSALVSGHYYLIPNFATKVAV